MGRATLQQERSRATRQAIIDAAEKLWSERGFDAVSVDEICQEARVAKGTFYFYFPRKEHLLVILRYDRLTPREGEFEALLASALSTAEICSALVIDIGKRASAMDKALVTRAVEESLRRHREVGKLEGGDRYLRTFFRPIFERGQMRGEVDPSWDANVLAGTLGWAVLQAIFGWAQDHKPARDLSRRLQERVQLITAGAATPRRLDLVVKSRGRRSAA